MTLAPPEPRVGTVVALYSHARRRDERIRTIAEFAAVGLPVAHAQVQIERPRPSANRRNAWAALKHAAEVIAPAVGARGVLLIEDDVTPAETLPEWLAYLEATETERPVTLYAPPVEGFYPDKLRRWAMSGSGRKPASQIVTLEALPRWWGAQAVWFPAALALSIARDQRLQVHEAGLGPWDSALRRILAERRLTLGLAVPNVVQHRAVPNVINAKKKPHASAAFLPSANAPRLPKELTDASGPIGIE